MFCRRIKYRYEFGCVWIKARVYLHEYTIYDIYEKPCIKTLHECLITHNISSLVIQVQRCLYESIYLNISTEVLIYYNQWAMTRTLSYTYITSLLLLSISKKERHWIDWPTTLSNSSVTPLSFLSISKNSPILYIITQLQREFRCRNR